MAKRATTCRYCAWLTCRISTLYHEALDVAMEYGAIVVAARTQSQEIFSSSRRLRMRYNQRQGLLAAGLSSLDLTLSQNISSLRSPSVV